MQDRLIGGRYRIVRKIAEGGMGEVYEAQHNLTKDTVALKILFPHIGKDEPSRQRFLREVSAPAQIGHDGIVKVTDAGFDPQDGSLFVAMELLDGEPMRDRLTRGGVSLDTLLDWFERILDPLAAAHEKGIVHRDLKPENVFMTRKRDGSEVLKILDFGIARDLDSSQSNVTHTGIAMGTPHYMAPEQAMSAKGVSAAADVWAIGIMLYEALCGRPPFDGETASAIVVHACTQAHASLLQVAPHVPPPLAEFVDRCLRKDPRDRPHHAGQMLGELRHVRQMIGSVSGVQSAGRAMGPTSGHGTGPIGAYTPKGTAVLPAGSQPGAFGGAFGTPPPGSSPGFGTPPPGSSPGAFGAPSGSAPGAFGPAFGAPSPAPGGFGPGSSPGAFGPPGGFGSPPHGTMQGFGSPSSGAPFGAPAPRKSGGGGGLALGLLAAVVIGGLVLVAGGIAVAALLSGEDTGTVRVQTDVTGGDLVVDGNSRGAATSGRRIELRPGVHTIELREHGQAIVTATVTVVADGDHTVTLNRPPRPEVQQQQHGTAMRPGNVQRLTGQLRRGDTVLPGSKYYDTHQFDWTAGTTVTIHLDSADFDTYLIVRAPSGFEHVNDDREPGVHLHAGLTLTLTETGRYSVLCSSFRPNVTGDYILTISTP